MVKTIIEKVLYVTLLIISAAVFVFPESDLYCIKESGKYGFIDSTGEIIIKPEYDYATSFSCGVSVVKKDNLFNLINQNGKIIKKDLKGLA